MTTLNFHAAEGYKHQRGLKLDATITALRTRTPAQIDAYLEANVTNLAQAREVLKALAKVVAYLVRREFA